MRVSCGGSHRPAPSASGGCGRAPPTGSGSGSVCSQVREAKAEIAAVGTEVSAAREQLLEAALTVFAADVQLTDADGASGAIAVARTAQAHAAAQCEQLSALPALNFVGGGESYGAGEARVLRRMLHFQLQSVRASVDDFGAEIESLEPEPEPEPEARKRR